MQTLNETELTTVAGGGANGARVGRAIGERLTGTKEGGEIGAQLGSAVEDLYNLLQG
jgi:hypothetical protein